MIRLNALKKTYAGRCVLDIPCLTMEEGRRYALIGPNGSGKSTLLRILAGVLKSDAGMAGLPEAMRGSMGYMPQRPYSYGITVLKNTLLAIPGKRQPHHHARAMAALKAVGLDGLAGAKGDRLSGGEAQRMAFARMLVRERKLLILDEPTSATDIAGNTLVENALLAYCEETGCTLVFATHSLAQADRLAQHILVLDHGLILEQGPVHEVLYRPQSEGAKAFLRYWRLEAIEDKGEVADD